MRIRMDFIGDGKSFRLQIYIFFCVTERKSGARNTTVKEEPFPEVKMEETNEVREVSEVDQVSEVSEEQDEEPWTTVVKRRKRSNLLKRVSWVLELRFQYTNFRNVEDADVPEGRRPLLVNPQEEFDVEVDANGRALPPWRTCVYGCGYKNRRHADVRYVDQLPDNCIQTYNHCVAAGTRELCQVPEAHGRGRAWQCARSTS